MRLALKDRTADTVVTYFINAETLVEDGVESKYFQEKM